MLLKTYVCKKNKKKLSKYYLLFFFSVKMYITAQYFTVISINYKQRVNQIYWVFPSELNFKKCLFKATNNYV